MGYQFNPITGNLDLVGSGGGGNPFDQDLNTTNDVTFDGLVVGQELGGYVQLGSHKSQLIATGTQTPLMIQGGSGAVEIWADESPSAANSFGCAVPGNSTTSDFVFARYNGGWAETFRLRNDTGDAEFAGNITAANLPTTFFSGSASDLTGTLNAARLPSTAVLTTGSQTLASKTLIDPAISNGTTSAILTADATNILAQRNGTTAQGLRVYNTFSDVSNYERGVFDWTTNSGQLTIGTQKLGTGGNRVTRIQASGQVDIYPFDLQSVRFSAATSIFYIPIEFAYYSAATDPTTATIGSGRCAIYRNTASGAVKLWVNAAGTMRSVALA